MGRAVRITWQKIRIHKSEDYGDVFGVGGEPGSSAEWLMFFAVRVNGVRRDDMTWERNVVRDDRTYTIDRRIDIDANGPISLRWWGLELDDTNASDDLPEIDIPLRPEQGWEDDAGVDYQHEGEAADYSYTVHFNVRYADSGVLITPGHGTLHEASFAGLWDTGQHRVEWSTGLTAAQVNAQAGELWGQGGRLAQLQPYVLGTSVVYNVIWRFDGRRQLWNLDCDDAHFRTTTGATWSWARPASVIPFVVKGAVRYAVLWDAGTHAQAWHPNTDDAGFRALTGQHWSWARPHQVHAFVVNGQVRYSCLWNAGTHSQVWHPNCSEEEAYKLGSQHWSWGRAHQMQPFHHNGQRRYSVLWNQGQQGQLWNLHCDQDVVAANTADTWDWARPRQLLSPSSSSA
jgi:hypothetical protein